MYFVDIPGREVVADVQEEEALPRSWGQGLRTTYRRRSKEGLASKAMAMGRCGGGEDK